MSRGKVNGGDWARAAAGARRIFVATDLDGTLIAHRARPSEEKFPTRRRSVLSALCGLPGVRLAIVSGRTRAQLVRLAAIRGAALVGEHGADEGGARPRHADAGPRGWLRRLDLPRAWHVAVEIKRHSLAFHVRGASAMERRDIEVRLRRFARGAPGLRLVRGHLVLELAPRAAHKGRFVRRWLARHRFDPRRDLCVVLGDQEPDEEAFRILGRRCVCVRVRPRGRTAAQVKLAGLEDVDDVLRALVRGARAGCRDAALRLAGRASGRR